MWPPPESPEKVRWSWAAVQVGIAGVVGVVGVEGVVGVIGVIPPVVDDAGLDVVGADEEVAGVDVVVGDAGFELLLHAAITIRPSRSTGSRFTHRACHARAAPWRHRGRDARLPA